MKPFQLWSAVGRLISSRSSDHLGVQDSTSLLDCSTQNYLTTLPISTPGVSVIYNRHLYTSKWYVNDIPVTDQGWEDKGPCGAVPPSPVCAAPWDQGTVYSTPTVVSFSGNNYLNKWYIAGTAPGNDPWLLVHPCGANSGGVTPPLSSSSSTTTTTTTTRSPTTKPSLRTVPQQRPTSSPMYTQPTQQTRPPVTTRVAAPPVVTQAPPAPVVTQAPPPVTQARPPVVTPPASSGGEESQVRPTSAVGPNGECIWCEWNPKQKYPTGSIKYYIAYNGGVYTQKGYCEAGTAPDSGDYCWGAKVASCTGAKHCVLSQAEAVAAIDPAGPEFQLVLDRWDPNGPSDAEAAQMQNDLIASTSAYTQHAIAALATLPISQVEAIAAGAATNPANVQRVERILTASRFAELFPVRHPSYTYENFLKAVGAFPAYCQTYTDGRDSDKICTKLMITSFAHNVQEVGANHGSLFYGQGDHLSLDGGVHYHADSDVYYTKGEKIPNWRQALWFLREQGFTEASSGSGYRKCTISSEYMWELYYQCPASKDYFGRGSKQLSWNYNYGLFSKLFFGDASYLLSNPNLVADTWLNFASGTWFSVTPQSPKPSMLDVIDGSWQPNAADQANGITAGFGATINIINGGLECNKTPSAGVQHRIDAYRNFADYFAVDISNEVLDCQNQRPFTAEGAGASTMYFSLSWSERFKCLVTSMQTAFVISEPNAYQDCLNHYFRGHWVDRDSKTVVSDYGQAPGSKPMPA